MKNGYGNKVLMLKAMADETRLRIVEMLTGGELCACKILEHFHITQPTLSYHMKILCESGIVVGRREGAWMRYSLNLDNLSELNEFFNSITTQKMFQPQGDCCIDHPEARI